MSMDKKNNTMTNEELVARIKAGIDTAENMLQLWEQNRGLIRTIAVKYKGYEELDDLRQQGYIGLCNAVENYRAGEGVPFANYAALWIRQSMTRYIENNGKLVRIPAHEFNRHLKYTKFLCAYEVETGRKPADLEACLYLGITPKQLKALKKSITMGRIGSLDSKTGEDGETTIGDLVPDAMDVEGMVLDQVEKKELRELLWSTVDTLPGKQPCVIRSIYQKRKTLKAAGEEAGITLERVRIIRNDALRRLRNKRKLREYMGNRIECMAYRHVGVEMFRRTYTSATEFAALEIVESMQENT